MVRVVYVKVRSVSAYSVLKMVGFISAMNSDQVRLHLKYQHQYTTIDQIIRANRRIKIDAMS